MLKIHSVFINMCPIANNSTVTLPPPHIRDRRYHKTSSFVILNFIIYIYVYNNTYTERILWQFSPHLVW